MYTIYGFLPTVQKCIKCDSAKRLCDAKGKPYEFKSLADEVGPDGPVFNTNLTDLLVKLDRPSHIGLGVPVIFWNDIFVGGFEQLRTHIATV